MKVCNVLAALIGIYSFLIWLRIILTWIRIPGQTTENPVTTFLRKIVDPYLSWFSSIKALRREHIDLTPIIALAVLSILQSILRMFGVYGQLTPGMVFATILQTFWGYIVSPLFWFIFIILVIRLVFCYHKSPRSIYYINMLDSMDRGFLDFVQKLFYGQKPVNDRTLVWTSVIFSLVGFLIAKYLLTLLVRLLVGA
jgi:YggT family protein